MFGLEEIPGWCAAVKVKDVTDDKAHRFFTDIDKIYEHAVRVYEVSAIVVSVNEDEVVAIRVLKELGFKKTAWVKNYLHKGRRTCLFIKQIPYKFINIYFPVQ